MNEKEITELLNSASVIDVYLYCQGLYILFENGKTLEIEIDQIDWDVTELRVEVSG